MLNQVFCKYCGKEIDDDSAYCRFCGKRLLSPDKEDLSPDKGNRTYDILPYLDGSEVTDNFDYSHKRYNIIGELVYTRYVAEEDEDCVKMGHRIVDSYGNSFDGNGKPLKYSSYDYPTKTEVTRYIASLVYMRDVGYSDNDTLPNSVSWEDIIEHIRNNGIENRIDLTSLNQVDFNWEPSSAPISLSDQSEKTSDTESISQRSEDPYMKQSASYTAAKQYDQAIATMSKAIGLHPKWLPYYKQRAELYSMNGDHEKSVADWLTLMDLRTKESMKKRLGESLEMEHDFYNSIYRYYTARFKSEMALWQNRKPDMDPDFGGELIDVRAGCGPVRIKERLENVLSALGRPDIVDYRGIGHTGSVYHYDSRGFRFYVSPDDHVDRIEFAVDFKPFLTVEGIGVTSTIEDIEQAYGRPKTFVYPSEEYGTSFVEYEGFAFYFGTSDVGTYFRYMFVGRRFG